MTRPTKKRGERLHLEEMARVLGVAWRLIEGHRESPDFRLSDAQGMFGLEHVLANSGAKVGTPKPFSVMREREGQRDSRLRALQVRFSQIHDTPLRVVLRGKLGRREAQQLFDLLVAVDWPSYRPGHRVELSDIPGLKGHATRAFRDEWLDVDSRCGWVAQDGQAFVQEAIDSKKGKLADYRLAVGPDVRLLVVADHLFASGMVDLPTDLTTVDTSGFSRVYFFARPRYVVEFSGGGQVLRRTSWPMGDNSSGSVVGQGGPC